MTGGGGAGAATPARTQPAAAERSRSGSARCQAPGGLERDLVWALLGDAAGTHARDPLLTPPTTTTTAGRRSARGGAAAGGEAGRAPLAGLARGVGPAAVRPRRCPGDGHSPAAECRGGGTTGDRQPGEWRGGHALGTAGGRGGGGGYRGAGPGAPGGCGPREHCRCTGRAVEPAAPGPARFPLPATGGAGGPRASPARRPWERRAPSPMRAPGAGVAWPPRRADQ